MAGRVGGQAVFEGVLMRGPERWAVAVRTPDGRILVRGEDLAERCDRWTRVPVVRGLLVLAEALPLGFRALRWSAVHGLGEPERRATPAERAVQLAVLVGVVAAATMLPTAAAAGLAGARSGVAFHAVEAALGIALLLVYVAAVGRLDQVRRLFQNHGAEHKVVAAHEAGAALTPEVVAGFTTRHVRCGTSFLLVIAAVSAAFSLALGHLPLPALLASRVLLVPLVAGVAAELQLRAADNVHRSWVRTLLRPGLALQGLTTREPTPAQLEVAIAALREALAPASPAGAVAPVRVGSAPELLPSG